MKICMCCVCLIVLPLIVILIIANILTLIDVIQHWKGDYECNAGFAIMLLISSAYPFVTMLCHICLCIFCKVDQADKTSGRH